MNKNELILKSDIIKMIEDKIKYYQTRPKYYYGNKAGVIAMKELISDMEDIESKYKAIEYTDSYLKSNTL